MAFKAWHIPVRLATGAYILNSGLSKRDADEETAKGLHGFATTAYPEFQDTPPEQVRVDAVDRRDRGRRPAAGADRADRRRRHWP